jgi:hypothetical protein
MNKVTALLFVTIASSAIIPQIKCEPNGPGFFFSFIYWLTNKKQYERRSPANTAPSGISMQDYFTQLKWDLNGNPQYKNNIIPSADVEAIIALARPHLASADLRNIDYANQLIRSAIRTRVEDQTAAILNKLEESGTFIGSSAKQAIIQSYGNNVGARLEAIPHLNGESLYQFFGTNLENSIRSSINNPTYAQQILQQSCTR